VIYFNQVALDDNAFLKVVGYDVNNQPYWQPKEVPVSVVQPTEVPVPVVGSQSFLKPPIDVTISSPESTPSRWCRSNFAPFGTYNPAGTVTAYLSGFPGGSVYWGTVYQDTSTGFWSAQFDPVPATTNEPCSLTVTLTGIAVKTISNIGFDDC
jgi:hypothetical protein